MTLKTIVLDTSVIAFLCQSTPPVDPKSLARWELVHGNSVRLFREAKLIIVPAPVITELCAGGRDGARIAAQLSSHAARLRIAALDRDAAVEAGKLIESAWRNRPEDLRRNALKFDALIFGIAISSGADAVLTTDGSDFSKLAASMPGNAVQVISMDTVLKGQLSLLPPESTNVVNLRDRK